MFWNDENRKMLVGDVWKNPEADCIYVVTKVGCSERGTGAGSSVFGIKQYLCTLPDQVFSYYDNNKIVHLTGDGYAAVDWRLLARIGKDI